jgi:hypothetical protein
VAVDRARLEEGFTSGRETSSLLVISGTAEERKTSEDMEENGRRGDRKRGKDWKEVGALAQNRICWRCFEDTLCS